MPGAAISNAYHPGPDAWQQYQYLGNTMAWDAVSYEMKNFGPTSIA